MNKDQGGWTSIEVMVALIIALIAMGSIAAAAGHALRSAARLRDGAAALIESRNAESAAVLELGHE